MDSQMKKSPGEFHLQRCGTGLKLNWTRTTEHPCTGQMLAHLSPADSILADSVGDINKILAKG